MIEVLLSHGADINLLDDKGMAILHHCIDKFMFLESKPKQFPTYLVRNPYSYCFRMNVPKDLYSLIGRKELRYSLKTGDIGTARYKARLIAGHVQQLF